LRPRSVQSSEDEVERDAILGVAALFYPGRESASENELNAAFATVVRAGAGALLVRGSPLFLTRRRQLVALATRHALLASYSSRDYAEVAGDSATSTFREKRDTKNGPWRQGPEMNTPWPNSAHGDRVISAKCRGDRTVLSDLRMRGLYIAEAIASRRWVRQQMRQVRALTKRLRQP
jgi:hypothetical protein